MKELKTIACVSLLIQYCMLATHIGYVVDPIADLAGNPLTGQSTIASYKDISLCGAKPTTASCCPRIHQAIFNEQVTIIGENNEEYHVELPTVYYLVNKKKECRYWIEKKAVKTVEQLKKENIDLNAFPRPSFSPDRYKQVDTVILIAPWHDHVSKRTYSAGTRFVIDRKIRNENDSHKKPDTIMVKLYDRKKRVINSYIPNNLVLLDVKKPAAGKREAFIKLLRTWTENNDGYIPYVWGGTSFTGRSHAGYISEVTAPNGSCSYYTLSDQKQNPKQGFDCSGLIARAAEIVGIPYFCKNSFAANLTLKHLTKKDTVLPGDIIWFPGHVIIISDPEKSLAIEARGYGVGFGKVHEIPVEKIFKNVKTIDDLQQMLDDPRKQITRIDRAGNTKETHYDFAILSLTEQK